MDKHSTSDKIAFKSWWVAIWTLVVTIVLGIITFFTPDMRRSMGLDPSPFGTSSQAALNITAPKKKSPSTTVGEINALATEREKLLLASAREEGARKERERLVKLERQRESIADEKIPARISRSAPVEELPEENTPEAHTPWENAQPVPKKTVVVPVPRRIPSQVTYLDLPTPPAPYNGTPEPGETPPPFPLTPEPGETPPPYETPPPPNLPEDRSDLVGLWSPQGVTIRGKPIRQELLKNGYIKTYFGNESYISSNERWSRNGNTIRITLYMHGSSGPIDAQFEGVISGDQIVGKKRIGAKIVINTKFTRNLQLPDLSNYKPPAPGMDIYPAPP